jgi:hypothetical protein
MPPQFGSPIINLVCEAIGLPRRRNRIEEQKEAESHATA